MRFFLFLCFTLNIAFADIPDIPSSFKDYKSYTFGEELDFYLFLSPKLSKNAKFIKNKNQKSLHLKLLNKSIEIGFSLGESDDYNFIITFKNSQKTLVLYAESMFLSERGFVYTVKRTNEIYTKYQKFKLVDERFKEVQQPYAKVGKVCHTSNLTNIYSEECGRGHIVATIPKGKSIEVLIGDTKNRCGNEGMIKEYLVQTSFGLIGWVSSSNGYMQRVGNPLSCLMYEGD